MNPGRRGGRPGDHDEKLSATRAILPAYPPRHVRCRTCKRDEPLSRFGNCRSLVDPTFEGLLLPQTWLGDFVQRGLVEIRAGGRPVSRFDWAGAA